MIKSHKFGRNVIFFRNPNLICKQLLNFSKSLVRSSNGHEELRPVVGMTVRLLNREWEIELTLTNRDEMGFRMLLGREALRNRFLVDPGKSFQAGRPVRKRRVKTKKEKA